MNKAIMPSPSLIVPLPSPPCQLPLVFTSITEQLGRPGPCIPRVRILRRLGGGGMGAALGLSSLPWPLREGSGRVRESTDASCRHISSASQLRRLKKGLYELQRRLLAAPPVAAALLEPGSGAEPSRQSCVLHPGECAEWAHWQSCTVRLCFNPDLLLCSPSLQVTTVIHPKSLLITCIGCIIRSSIDRS